MDPLCVGVCTGRQLARHETPGRLSLTGLRFLQRIHHLTEAVALHVFYWDRSREDVCSETNVLRQPGHPDRIYRFNWSRFGPLWAQLEP